MKNLGIRLRTKIVHKKISQCLIGQKFLNIRLNFSEFKWYLSSKNNSWEIYISKKLKSISQKCAYSIRQIYIKNLMNKTLSNLQWPWRSNYISYKITKLIILSFIKSSNKIRFLKKKKYWLNNFLDFIIFV